MTEVATDPLVVFTPSGRRGRFPTGTTVLDAARQLGVDIDSVCGGHGLCGRCQVEPTEGRFAKHGITVRGRPSLTSPAAGDRVRRRSVASRPERRLGCLPRCAATSSSTSRPRARSTARSCARIRRSARSSSTRSSGSTTSRSSLRPWRSPSGDLGRLQDALAREWDLHDLDADLEVVGAIERALRDGRLEGHGGGPRRRRHHGGLARLPRPRLWRRDRHRLDDDRGASRRPDLQARSSAPTA